jgi:hypothetical protein
MKETNRNLGEISSCSKKKQREIGLIGPLIDKEFNGQEPESVDGESPDFVFFKSSIRIGVEVTEVHRVISNPHDPDSRLIVVRETDMLARRVLQEAQQQAEAAGVPELEVFVYFNSDRLTNPRVETLAKYIGDMVIDNWKRATQFLHLIDQTTRSSDQPSEIVDLQITSGFGALWHANEAAWLERDFSELLQSMIYKKERLLGKYLKRCDECWLFIVAPGDSSSSYFRMSAEVRAHVFSSSFSRVYFSDCFERKAERLTTQLRIASRFEEN